MYIRRIANKTGTVSVQVISKHTGKYKVMRSFGTGRNEQEIVRLEEHARQFTRFHLCNTLKIFLYDFVQFPLLGIHVEQDRFNLL